ncbi:MOSC domain protein, partial [Aspergillus brunneoviolaceus CBS 621.78]
LYTYPIKSIRGTALSSATATRTGFLYDRRFMLLKVLDDGTLKNMHVPHFPEMSLFQAEIVLPSEDGTEPGQIIVTFRPAASETLSDDNGTKSTRILHLPLCPDTRQLGELAIVMHQSPTKGYNMGAQYNDWFSEWFGYPVVLAYLGPHSRRVLGSFEPSKSAAHAGAIYDRVGARGEGEERITFADTAPYLLVSATSVDNVSERLGGGLDMDVTKFRPNIVVAGAKEAFEEDFWAEVVIGSGKEGKARLLLTANCIRCQSLNVDYATGAMAQGEMGNVLKKLMKDRRVDKGAKFSPVFGRYVFLDGESEGQTVQVGDEVVVTRRMDERMVYGEY